MKYVKRSAKGGENNTEI